MTIKKILIVGNHTCGNRGDSAILRGLITGISQLNSNIEVTITSRFPESSSFLLGKELILDELHFNRQKKINNLILNKIKKIQDKVNIKILESKVSEQGIFRFLPLSKKIKNHINSLSSYDAVIQVGGSFFVDSYGFYQFEHSLCALYAKKALLIIGHSVGPFNGKLFKKVSNTVFNNATFLGLREEVSLDIIKKDLNIHNTVHLGTDTAWLVTNNKERNVKFKDKLPKVAITVRSLSPFDKKLNVKQEDYEKRMADFCSNLIKLGYGIVALSTCTGIEGYNKDDRIIALRIKKLCGNHENFEVLMNEYNDVEIGEILSKCTLTVGTRLHSAIISMNFGTPAFALNYEHKSEGIMKNLNMPDLSVSFHDLMNKELDKRVMSTLNDIENITLITNKKVIIEKSKALEFVNNAIKNI